MRPAPHPLFIIIVPRLLQNNIFLLFIFIIFYFTFFFFNIFLLNPGDPFWKCFQLFSSPFLKFRIIELLVQYSFKLFFAIPQVKSSCTKNIRKGEKHNQSSQLSGTCSWLCSLVSSHLSYPGSPWNFVEQSSWWLWTWHCGRKPV